MMSMFRETAEDGGKASMTRFAMFAFVVLAYVAVILGRDAATVSAIIGGGATATLSKMVEVVKKVTGGKESEPTT